MWWKLDLFFGGTTRAIALGMANNINRNELSKFYTIDNFESYYNTDQLAELLATLVSKGVLSKKHMDSLSRSPKSSFLNIFED